MKIIVYCLIIVVIVLLHIILMQRRKREIRDLRKYVKAINEKNYSLKIEDNKEGEISKLRNELYKIGVTLKETAESSISEKEELSNAMANISHQLKTPLTSIRIMLDNIEENPQMNEETRQGFIKEISKQIDWINSLVIMLLKMAKFDANMVELKKEEICIKKMIEQVLNNLSIIIDIKNINVSIDIPENASIVGDYKWEVEALTNILKNSIEHSSENSNVKVMVKDNNLFLKIIIVDEGEGIEKEDLKHIFERFYKAKNASENSIGIGLSLAKAILEKDNGYINVTSEVGKGTTFEIKYLK